MAKATPPPSERRVQVDVRCNKGHCRGEPLSWFEAVPWYMVALPVLRIHVNHGGCVGQITYDLREV